VLTALVMLKMTYKNALLISETATVFTTSFAVFRPTFEAIAGLTAFV
jgi:hypothetical protein